MAKLTFWFAVSLILAALIATAFLLDRPLTFAYQKATNHFYRNGQGLPRDISAWLIESGLARDWATPQQQPGPAARYPLLLTAATSRYTYPFQSYTESGQPLASQFGGFAPPAGARVVAVDSVKKLISAIESAQPGDLITIAPGSYDMKTWSVAVHRAGTASLPVYVRAKVFGTVQINLDTLEGFHVTAPFWVFENLRVRGTCTDHNYCEHAFHIVGAGKSFTLRNSEVVNFNAPIKVNMQQVGGENTYADNGLLEYNAFYNEAPRNTGKPVTLLNINSADGWLVRGNYIADFVKNGSDRTSYGAFMKGNGRGGTFERNLVLCEHRLRADQGIRVGLSFGGGGTSARYCKEQNCTVEFSGGIMRNNIIMHCSRDVGIYLNRAANSGIYHNLLFNTLGVDVRFETSSALISNNIISGRIAERDRGRYSATGNVVLRGCLGPTRTNCDLYQLYQAPDQADFRLKSLENTIWQELDETPDVVEDFCGRPIPAEANVGPIQYRNELDCLALPTLPGPDQD